MKLLGKRLLTLVMTLSMLLTLCPMALAEQPDQASAKKFSDANAVNNAYPVDGTIRTMTAAGEGKLAKLSFEKPADYNTMNKDRQAYYAAVCATDGPDTDSIHYVPLVADGNYLKLEYFQYKATKFDAQLVRALPRGGSSEIKIPTKIEYNGGPDPYTIEFSATLTMSETMAQIADTCYRVNPSFMEKISFMSHIRFNYGFDAKACDTALKNIKFKSEIFVIDEVSDETKCVIDSKTDKCIGFDIKCKLKGDFWKLTAGNWEAIRSAYKDTYQEISTALNSLKSEMKYTGEIALPSADIEQALNAGTNLYFYGWNSIEKAPKIDRSDFTPDMSKAIEAGNVNVPALVEEVIVKDGTKGELIIHVIGGENTKSDNLTGATVTLLRNNSNKTKWVEVGSEPTPDDDGKYTFNVPYGVYKVIVSYPNPDPTKNLPLTAETTVPFLKNKLTNDNDDNPNTYTEKVRLNWILPPEGKVSDSDTLVVTEPKKGSNREKQNGAVAKNVNNITSTLVTADSITKGKDKNKENKNGKENEDGSLVTLSQAYEEYQKDVTVSKEYMGMNVEVKLNVTKVANPDNEKDNPGEPVHEIINKSDALTGNVYAAIDTKVTPGLNVDQTQLVIPSYIEATIDESYEFWKANSRGGVVERLDFESDIHNTVGDTLYEGAELSGRDNSSLLVTFAIPIPDELKALLEANGKNVNDIRVFRFHGEGDKKYHYDKDGNSTVATTEAVVEFFKENDDRRENSPEYYEIVTYIDSDGVEQTYIYITAQFFSVFGFGVELDDKAIEPPPPATPTPTGGGGSGGTPVVPPPVEPPVVEPGDAELNKVDHYGYIIGYPVDYWTGEATNDQPKMPVRPERNITRAEVATIYFRMLTDASRDKLWATENSFTDVPQDAWYNAAVSTLANGGILNGDPDGKFRPDDPITRAEFASIAVRFFGGEYSGADRFSDIAGHWANTNINVASDVGLINGYPDGTFGPNKNILRCEAIAIVNRTLDRHPVVEHFLPDMLVWPDNMDTSKWYYADMQEATNSHDYTMQGSGNSKYEIWTKILPIRNWSALEKEWSDSHSAGTGGEVMNP